MVSAAQETEKNWMVIGKTVLSKSQEIEHYAKTIF